MQLHRPCHCSSHHQIANRGGNQTHRRERIQLEHSHEENDAGGQHVRRIKGRGGHVQSPGQSK